MDDPSMSQGDWERAQRGISRMCRSFGNHAAVLRALRRDPAPVRRVLDVGCGSGALMRQIRHRLGVEVVGVDLRAPGSAEDLPIVEADAVRDPLPRCDVAVSVWMAHHLSGADLVELIRNVGRSARRLVLLDLVRHPLPLALFRTFVTPFLSSVNAEDGIRSIRRAFTPAEMRAAAAEALDGAGAGFSHTVAPFHVRQVLDVRYTP